MSFINPLESASIPTYRVMDSDGVLVDKARGRPDVPNEEVLTWYKNMLTGESCTLALLLGTCSRKYMGEWADWCALF
jgi:hypothetical protein